ncbi:OmpA family protein, partial [Desulfovibrio sp. OttesenSCG-928-F07]|nr:OmpA family protein [Desulfovibrio sp. OttesenSCG-928-F07]
MYRILAIFTALVLCLSITTVAVAKEEPVRKIESFDFLIDYSKTMSGRKFDKLGKVFKQINDEIPELEYPQAGIHSFSPETELYPFEVYKRDSYAEGIDKTIDNFAAGKNFSAGQGFDHYDPMFADMLRKGAVIVMTDGDYGKARDSVNEAKIVYLTQPGLCIHFISFASSDAHQKVIDDMASISDCSVSVKADDLLDNNDATKDFVRRVFYDVVEHEDPVIDFFVFSLPFAFDSDQLDERTAKVAQAVADRMKAQPAYMLKIDGYTCTLGKYQYNVNLSQRRANSVRNYIINAGVEAHRITAEGHGPDNPRYDNNTAEGRSLNRRV